MKKLLVMLLLAMSAVVFTVGCVTSSEHILTVKQLEELLETKTAAQIFEEDLINGNRKTSNDILCIDAAGLSFLLKKGLDVNAKSESGSTVLDSAAWHGKLEVVKYLVEKGADVNAKSGSGYTVLHSAASSGNLEMVKYLVEKGADVNAKNDDGRTPADVARKQEIKDYLKSKMK